MSELSTVQQLWRDRREEFEAYLNGEMTCHNSAGEYLSTPVFDFDGSMYQFRPLPKPPKLRPLTREEWIERRDWWVREKGTPALCRINVILENSIETEWDRWEFKEAFHVAEMSPDCINFQPCGVPESEVTE